MYLLNKFQNQNIKVILQLLKRDNKLFPLMQIILMLHLDPKYISLNNKNRYKIYKNRYKVYNLNYFKCNNLYYKNTTMNLVIIQHINQQPVNQNIVHKYNHH